MSAPHFIAPHFVGQLGLSLYAAAGMFWTIFWPLVLGFALSSAVQAFVPKDRVAGWLGGAGVKELGLAAFFGAVSSSCSYAAASMARSLFQKGAHIVAALAFMFASTNLVFELSAVLWVMLGWQFVLAEIVGGLILIAVMAILMRAFGPLAAFEARREKALERTAASEPADPRTLAGWRVAARIFVGEWKMLWKDIALGAAVSGVLMVFVPDRFWQSLFLDVPGPLQTIENALIGPLVSMASFACSIGNIPVAGVLYHGGITFGGAISVIYADLIIIPLILVYRRQYGGRLAVWITGVFYASIVVTSVIVDLLFKALGLVPERHAMTGGSQMEFFAINHTFWLNLAGLAIGAALVAFASTGPAPDESSTSCCHDE